MMDEIITKIQFESLHLHIYKRYSADEEQKQKQLADTLKTKTKLLKELRMLVKDWPYVPFCAEALLDDLHE